MLELILKGLKQLPFSLFSFPSLPFFPFLFGVSCCIVFFFSEINQRKHKIFDLCFVLILFYLLGFFLIYNFLFY